MKNKIVGLFLALCMVIAVLTGCAGKTTQGSNTQSDDSKPVTLTLSFWEPGVNRDFENSLKEITAEYTKIHPNVTFELSSQPVSGYANWMKARMAANEMPDIEENHAGDLSDHNKQGFLMNLENEFNSANPYADNMIWKDMFIDGKLEAAENFVSSATYAIPYSGLGLAYYYNKDIYEKFNLKEPKTWDELMSNCQVLLDNKYNPIALMMLKNDAVDWLNWYIITGLFANKYLADERINLNKDRVINSRETARAIQLGLFDITKGEDKEACLKYFSMLKQLSEYTEGASGLDEGGAKAQFLAGKAAHIMSGSWDLKSFSDNKSFKVGAFPLPRFTKANGQYAGDNFTISAVQVFGITKSAEKSPERAKAAVDFMKFFTAPKNYKSYIEKTYSIPVVKNVDVPSAFNAFQGGTCEPLYLFGLKEQKSKTNFEIATSIVMSDKQYDTDKLLSELQQSFVEYSKNVMDTDGLNKDNNFKVDEFDKQGQFVPTKAYDEQ